jgi:hypothetical protein
MEQVETFESSLFLDADSAQSDFRGLAFGEV